MIQRAAPWLVLVALALVYPLVSIGSGSVTFPTRTECATPATGEGEVDAVFGYFEDPRPAVKLRDRALAVGFVGTEAGWDACGRMRVALTGIPTLAVGEQFAEQARNVGFEIMLEQAA